LLVGKNLKKLAKKGSKRKIPWLPKNNIKKKQYPPFKWAKYNWLSKSKGG